MYLILRKAAKFLVEKLSTSEVISQKPHGVWKTPPVLLGLISMVEGIIALNQFVVDDQVIKKNKLNGITEMIINLNELNNSDNLKDGRPSNELLTYHVTDDKDFMHFEPQTPQYRKLKNGEFTSLNLRITDQNNNVITDGLQVTVVLHIRDCKNIIPY